MNNSKTKQAARIALEAYRIASESPVTDLAALKAAALAWATDHEVNSDRSSIRRAILCLLVVAELSRGDDPGPFRLRARELGARITPHREADPAYWYMQVVDLTTRRVSSADFNDPNPGAQKADQSFSDVQHKLGFSPWFDPINSEGTTGVSGFRELLEREDLFAD
jgi:hypothetical protein